MKLFRLNLLKEVIPVDTLNKNTEINYDLKIGSALMDKDYYLKMADESLCRFLGEFEILPIIKNIQF